jgi:surfeit locus 1 family protein
MWSTNSLSSIPSFEYRKVRIFGTWDHAHSVLLGPRSRDNVIGYHIITPLRRGEGASTILVDRGFVSRDLVKNDPSIFAKSSGSNAIVEVVGLLRQSQTRNRFTPDNNVEKGEWYWADVDALAQHAGGPHVGVQPVLIEAIFGACSCMLQDIIAYFTSIVDGNTGEASERVATGVPVGRVPNVELRNMHATYAITWRVLALS